MSEAATTDLLGRLDAVVFEADPKTLQVTFAAGGALRRLGFSTTECIVDAQFLIKRLHPDDREQFLSLLRAVADDGKERQIEHRMVSADGQERWFRTEFHCMPSERQLLGLMIDATDARRTAERLRAAEGRLREVVNNAPVVLFALDRNGIITLSEGSALRQVGLQPGEIVGRSIFEFYPPDSDLHAITRRALAGEKITRRRRTPGAWWETHLTPLLDDSGRPVGVTGVLIDLSDRLHAEDLSAQAASLLRATLEATTDGILVVDNVGRIVDHNLRFGEMWSIPADVLAARDDARALSVVVEQLRDPDGFLAKVRALYAEPGAISHDVIEFRDGRIFERDSRPQIVDGVSVGRVWSFRDVSAERRATRRATFLAAASKILAGPLEDVTPLDVIARLTVPWLCDWCNILLIDDDGHVSTAAAYHHDASKIELLRQLKPDMRFKDRAVARVIATGEPSIDNQITDAQLEGPLESATVSVGTREQLEMLRTLGLRARLAVPLRARGQIIGAMVFASTDAERHFDNDDLTLAMDLAQRAALAIDNHRLYQSSKQAVALRDEFLSVASHELRTPVTSLQLAVQSALTVGPEAPPGFLRHSLESAERQTRRLGRLVDALLDVSRIQAGRLELMREPTDLAAVVHEVVSLLAEDARRAGCEVSVEAPSGDTPVVGNWDKVRLEQVVTNLLSNAIKYGAGASIAISISAGGGRARLAVRDRGIGVDPAERGRIFERFERAVSSKHYGGLGLGLYIVRRIVDAHDGAIAVESAAGAGSQFIVELPLQ
ncbi:MAG: Chemotaxis protein methyltransferase CheR [bacterium]|nr:Chemotaxis protein methyltransferase CheR [bacterium]